MRRAAAVGVLTVLLAACATPHLAPKLPATAWDQRVHDLQTLPSWQMDGRAAAALGNQGWQASLDWRESGELAEVHLSGPLGVGAVVLRKSAQGVSLNGAAPGPEVLDQLQAKLGFELPLDHLRYWLLGVPDPSAAFDITRNVQDRAARLVQSDWTVDFDLYVAVGNDVLPAHIVMNHEGVRVRIAVDHWQVTP